MTKFVSTTKPKSSAQIVAKQHMKKHLKRIRNREYGRLRDMVPAIANKQNVSKVPYPVACSFPLTGLFRGCSCALKGVHCVFDSSDVFLCSENCYVKCYVNVYKMHWADQSSCKDICTGVTNKSFLCKYLRLDHTCLRTIKDACKVSKFARYLETKFDGESLFYSDTNLLITELVSLFFYKLQNPSSCSNQKTTTLYSSFLPGVY